MNVVLATIIPIFLLMPGFAFIAGVNITDKTIREIVFRSTPAEVAYVVATSLLVHFVFSLIPWWIVNPGLVLAAGMAVFHDVSVTSPNAGAIAAVVRLALWYFILSSLLGGLLGVGLGLAVAKWQTRVFIMRVFVKHRWMTMFIGLRGHKAVYARVLTTPVYKTSNDGEETAIFIEGVVRDSYFDADGTLLYLVFTGFKTRIVKPGRFPTEAEAAQPARPDASLWPNVGPGGEDRLVIEGDHVALVRYEPVRIGGVVGPSDEAALERAAAEDDPQDSQYPRGA